MGRTNRPALALACLLALLLVQLPRGARATGDLCGKVKCGMGSCGESGDYMFGFACRCNPGWSRYHLGDVDFPFLPCVMPNSCLMPYCGGGTCEKVESSAFAHRFSGIRLLRPRDRHTQRLRPEHVTASTRLLHRPEGRRCRRFSTTGALAAGAPDSDFLLLGPESKLFCELVILNQGCGV
ncbi:unnamed protein product [Triticum turgidum subsp. durum]|uniref:EGF-like domain-containing protein n=1 Tax=Triticum turgidum subsp. durum TaxID=4567 RepID=A0A9R0ZH86_TRITD|nr:unnamed protein product [Triticum turgidum subsp. durum]